MTERHSQTQSQAVNLYIPLTSRIQSATDCDEVSHPPQSRIQLLGPRSGFK